MFGHNPHPQTRGNVMGVAGGGLTGDVTWAANSDVARIGRIGEVRTAQVLDPYAHTVGGPTVLHDLAVPIPNITANIDHVVVVGRTIHLIDSKMWAPGLYFTLGGKTRRYGPDRTGHKKLERFTPAEKKTMQMAAESIERYLASRGVKATVATPVLAVWPSNRHMAFRTFRLVVPGARVMLPDAFARHTARLFSTKGGRSRLADPHVVAALGALLNPRSVGRPAA